MAQISPVSSKATSSRVGALKPGSVRKVSGEKSSTGTKAVEKSVKNPDGKPDSEEASSSSETDSKKDDAGEIAKAENSIAEKLGRELSDKEREQVAKKVVEQSSKFTEKDVETLAKDFQEKATANAWSDTGAKDLGTSNNTNQSDKVDKIENNLGENKSGGDNSGGNSNQGGQQNSDDKGFTSKDPIQNKNPNEVDTQGGNKEISNTPENGSRLQDLFSNTDKLIRKSDANSAADNFNQSKAPEKSETSPRAQGPQGGGINGQGIAPPQQINMSQMQMQQQSQGIQQINQLNQGQGVQQPEPEVPEAPSEPPPPPDFLSSERQ